VIVGAEMSGIVTNDKDTSVSGTFGLFLLVLSLYHVHCVACNKHLLDGTDELGRELIHVCMQSEYVADADKRREFVSGFSGSAGKNCVSLAMLAKLRSSDQEELHFHRDDRTNA
jgi:hypothetical protein